MAGCKSLNVISIMNATDKHIITGMNEKKLVCTIRIKMQMHLVARLSERI